MGLKRDACTSHRLFIFSTPNECLPGKCIPIHSLLFPFKLNREVIIRTHLLVSLPILDEFLVVLCCVFHSISFHVITSLSTPI